MNSIAKMKSFLEMFVFLLINFYLFFILCIAFSRGIFVNKEVASKEIRISFSLIFLPQIELYKSKLLLTCLSLYTILSEMI